MKKLTWSMGGLAFIVGLVIAFADAKERYGFGIAFLGTAAVVGISFIAALLADWHHDRRGRW